MRHKQQTGDEAWTSEVQANFSLRFRYLSFARQAITAQDAHGWLRHCGYQPVDMAG